MTYNNKKFDNKKWFIMLGQNGTDYFDLNLTKEKQHELVDTIRKMKWDKVFHDQGKTYQYEDMKYIINNRNRHMCQKTKVLSYNIQNNALIGQYSLINLPIENFPPTIDYHDMVIVERTVFVKDSTQVQVKIINHSDNLISYEIRIESANKDEAIEFAKKLNYDLVEFKPTYIEHGDHYVLSVI